MGWEHWMLIGVAAALVGVDIFLAVDDKKGNTISEIITKVSNRPVIPFAFGVLMGHWFW